MGFAVYLRGRAGHRPDRGCKGGRALKGNAWSEIARTAQYCLQNENTNTNTTSNATSNKNTNTNKNATSNTNTIIIGNTNTKIG